MTFQVDSPGTVLISTLLDILALDILGLDILGLDILGLDILGRFLMYGDRRRRNFSGFHAFIACSTARQLFDIEAAARKASCTMVGVNWCNSAKRSPRTRGAAIMPGE